MNEGGNGTVTFSYTEAGKTASITVQWWKLYLVGLKLSYEHLMCNIHLVNSGRDLVLDETKGYDLSRSFVTATYNDGIPKEIGRYDDNDVFSNNVLMFTNKGSRPGGISDDNWKNYYLKHTSTDVMTVIPQRKGTVTVRSPKSYRGLYLEQDINVWAAGAISTSKLSFVFPQKFLPGDTYYAAYIDADGGHVCDKQGTGYSHDIAYYRGGGLYYASDHNPTYKGYFIDANTIVEKIMAGYVRENGTMTFMCWNEYTYKEINTSGWDVGKFAEYPKAGSQLSPRPISVPIYTADWPNQ